MSRKHKPSNTYITARADLIQQRQVSRNSLDPIQRLTTAGASSRTVKTHKPRNTWHQRGWSNVSPYYSNSVTIDSRWDKPSDMSDR